jgi:hypothetical protein
MGMFCYFCTIIAPPSTSLIMTCIFKYSFPFVTLFVS